MPAETNTLSVPKTSEKLFRRGFKSWCDNTSLGIRTKLGLRSSDPLSPHDLAERLGVTIIDIADLKALPKESLEYLSVRENAEWSAVTVELPGGCVIVVNPTHSDARKSSNIMHELSHIICKHKSGQIVSSPDLPLLMRSYDEVQENEANWLAGSLLLTRNALFTIARSSDLDQSLSDYGVSKSLYNWRLNVTGVRRQLIAMQ